MSEPGKSSTRTIRRVEAPRPLKKAVSDTKNCSNAIPLSLPTFNIDSVEKLVMLIDMIVEAILQNEDSPNNMSGDAAPILTNNVAHLCKYLKIFGPQMENKYRGQLDRMCSVFQNAVAGGLLEHETVVNMLDVLELRECSWKKPISEKTNPLSTSVNKSGIFSNLKNYVKSHSTSSVDHEENRKQPKSSKHVRDEVMIKNSDSGKVNPIAKERLVQINGANEENVASAVRLIRETIRNNASPVLDRRSESDSNISSVESFTENSGCDELDSCESELSSVQDIGMNNKPCLFKHTVKLSNCELTITGQDYTYVTVAKAILDGYFSNLRKSDGHFSNLRKSAAIGLKNGGIDCADDIAMLNNEPRTMRSLSNSFLKAKVPKPSVRNYY